MFPLVRETLTGEITRALLIKRNDRWEFATEDVGSLVRCLSAYRIMLAEIERSSGESTFLVERNSRINYVNLYRFMIKLENYGVQFLESAAINYKQLETQKLIPDPLILNSLGINERREKTKALVPAA